ncbi:MAG: sodium-independent anion transporter [Nitrosomonadales bacterium]|nr:MAG: sodium-independent anion transporter [Nitrosomonadales bacterium]
MSLTRILPFLRWLPLRTANIKADLIAGITVALVLIPQSMAYAQLAGLPAYYGLYAAFLPGIVAAMWGSSAQLATGPVAVASLLTASALAPLAAAGSEQFVALAILLALLVGLIQLALGIFKLGVVVNFLSHPVIVGFTNAAAIIIGLSQLNKLFGVSMGRSEHFINDIWGVLQQVGDTHIPTLVMGVAAFAIMWGLKKYAPKMPGVLIAVAVTTVASWAIGFEHNSKGRIDDIVDAEVKTLANEFSSTEARMAEIGNNISAKSAELKRIQKDHGEGTQHTAALKYEIELLKLEQHDAENENRKSSRTLRKFIFEQVPGTAGQPAKLHLAGQVPQGEKSDGYRWRIKKVSKGELKLVGGGEVVGSIPSGLPKLGLPALSWDTVMTLLSSALVISLVGFMEAISIAKAIAAKTKERIDPNQELLGQGISNIVGSFSQAFPVSGSFSRSAVNLNAGAKTGMSSVFAGIIVLVTLLFLTPLLYHLPQAVLAAVIMMAVIGLVNFKAIKHAWHAHKHDGVAAVVTFIATLAFAPHLDNGIMAGAGLAIILYLYRTMSPRVAILGRYKDGTLRDISVHKDLPTDENIIVLRFDGSLYFANVPFFEDAILEAAANKPNAKYLVVVGDGINQLDASGEEVIHHLVERLNSIGMTMVFSGLKKQVLDVMRHTGLFDLITANNIFANEEQAFEAIYNCLGTHEGAFCQLRRPA